MACRRMKSVWLGAAALLAAVLTTSAFAQTTADEGPTERPLLPRDASEAPATFAPTPLDLDDFPAETQKRVRPVVEQPTVAAHGPMEIFTCQPSMYHWLLDHPDQAVKLWRRLGAKCIEIQDQGAGRFSWKDGASEVHWEVVQDGPRRRVWYAEGQVKPGLLLPTVPFKAILVLDYAEGKDSSGRPAVRHQMQMILHTDSKVVALATKLVGDSAPKSAEKFLAQLQMFYAAMSWFLDQHPDRADKMFAALQQPDPPGTKLNTPVPPQSADIPKLPER
jgi:hypothetical protein